LIVDETSGRCEMGTSHSNGESEPHDEDVARWKLGLVPEFASAALALAALVVSVISMYLQTSTADEQTKLAESQAELTKDQRDLDSYRAREESLPRVSSWLLPDDLGGASLYIINRDKDPLTGFDVHVRGQRVSLHFVPPCTRTTILLAPYEAKFLQEDPDGWSAYFRSADEWWTFDASQRVIRHKATVTPPATWSWRNPRYSTEPDCET
jgi:hypothetical protein